MIAKKQVGVCLSPVLVDQFDLTDCIVVVIDVLRATTSMCVALDNGATSITPVLNVDECRKYRDEGYLISAERNGEMIEGFDFGNSPFSFMGKNIKDKKIAMTTTNGTVAINAAVRLNAKEVIVGSFANFNALIKYLKKRDENVLLLCAAWKGRPNLEDTIFAGAVVRRLRSSFDLYEDTALMAEVLYRSASRRKRYYLKNSSHFNRLMHILQIQKDVKYALRRDTHPVVPILVGDKLIDMNSPVYHKLRKEQRTSEKKSGSHKKIEAEKA